MANGADKTRIFQRSLPANARRIPIPAAALGPWLAEIDDPSELKVTLRAVASLAEGANRRGVPPSIALDDLLDDPFLTQGGDSVSIRRGLAAALERGTLLAVVDRGEVRVFLNDDTARRHLETAELEPLSPADVLCAGSKSETIQRLPKEQPAAPRANIFALYEEHIGPYGHNMAERLKAAEADYPINWIKDAFSVAAERNAVNWNYVEGILRRWVKEGRYTEAAVAAGQRRDQYHEHGKPGDDTTPDSRSGYLESYRRRHGRLPWESGEPAAD